MCHIIFLHILLIHFLSFLPRKGICQLSFSPKNHAHFLCKLAKPYAHC
nr:MAG TPA: hypothetical protein [Caudoviricetes sp.]